MVKYNLSLVLECNQSGKIFSRDASCLDAFSTYHQERGYSAVPAWTTDTLEAPEIRSSRTDITLLSFFQQIQKKETNLSHNGLNPAHVPF